VLLNRGYDYWALGHIHARSVPPLHESPYIAYSGNLQGRHIRETGAKGCLVVTVDEGDLTAVEFVATDTVRWQTLEVSLEPHAGRSELLDAVRQQLASCRESAEGRLVATRVIVRGVCEVHRQLARAADHAEITAEIRNLAGEVSDDVWVEKIVFDTRPPVDVDQLRQGSDLMGELLRSMQEVADDPLRLAELKHELKALGDKAALELHEADVLWEDPQQLRRWLQQAEALLISRLTEDEP
jgi:DNA repair exonuclease SbcCD nuclease subunit